MIWDFDFENGSRAAALLALGVQSAREIDSQERPPPEVVVGVPLLNRYNRECVTHIVFPASDYSPMELLRPILAAVGRGRSRRLAVYFAAPG